MLSYNAIAVFNAMGDRILLCRRRKNPYKGLSNFVGGKIKPGEDGLTAAYRELWEETAITREDVCLTHFMDFVYHVDGIVLEVYAGQLRRDVPVHGEENELYWSPLDCNFFDPETYAGDGNLGHILRLILAEKEKVLLPME